MSLAAISLIGLFAIVFLSCVTKLNVGILAMAMAWIVGVYLGGMRLEEVVAGFPVQLFLTLVGMTLLFTQAQLNGTLDKLAYKAVRLCRGNVGAIPIMFFFLAAGLASLGPGNIASAALMAPVAMAIGGQTKVPAFLMAIMVGNGANAGSLSPFAPTGIIVNGLMTKIGLPGLDWPTYWTNLAAHAGVAFAAYLIFGGLRLFARQEEPSSASAQVAPLERAHWITLVTIALLLSGVIFLQVNAGMAAFFAAALLGILRVADHGESIRKMPWNVIVMVSGVTVLVALLEKTQGIALFSDLLAAVATKDSVTGVVAFLTGIVSVYSSTSGVVLPAFLPTVPGLAARVGGADPAMIAFSMNVGSHLVDMSPLSTIGALCIASAAADVDPRKLFNSLLAWGLSMTVVGAAVCWVFFR